MNGFASKSEWEFIHLHDLQSNLEVNYLYSIYIYTHLDASIQIYKSHNSQV